MPRLARKNIKVFAGSATNNGVFGSLQANNPTITSDVEQLQSLNAWGQGWNAATETSEELPPLEEIQGVEYVTTYQQAYIMQEGIPEWAATVTYYKGCLAKEVTSTGFRIYNSLTDNNTGNLLSDTSNWKKVIDSDDLYAFDSAVVHDTGNETIAGVKTFSSSPLVPTPSNSDNSKKAATTAFVKAQGYANDSSVVHKTGNETISGIKTFENVIKTYQNNRIISRVNKDTGKTVATIETNSNEPTNNGVGLFAFDKDETTNVNMWLNYNNGSPYLSVSDNVSYVVTDRTQKVPTTKWVKNVMEQSGGMSQFSKSKNGYIKLLNGIIIQWGRVDSISTSSYTTVTLPIAFTSTNYSVSATMNSITEVGNSRLFVRDKKTASFGLDWTSPIHADGADWIAIGY